MKRLLLLITLILTSILSAYEVEMRSEIKTECDFYKGYTMMTRAFDIEKVSETIAKEYSFSDTSMYVGEMRYPTGDIKIFKKIGDNKESLIVYNTATQEHNQFDYSPTISKIGFKSKDYLSINVSENYIAEFTASAFEKNELSLSRRDICRGELEINDKKITIIVEPNSLNIGEDYRFLVDINGNGIYDLRGGTNETFTKGDLFEVDGKLLKISSITPDGSKMVIDDAERKEAFALECYMPNFKHYNRDSGKVSFFFWWSPGCGGAISGVPAVNMIWDKYKDNENLNFLALTDCSEEQLNEATKELKSIMGKPLEVNYPSYCNETEFKPIFGESFPKVAVADQNGVIKYIGGCSMSFSMKKDAEDPNFKNYDGVISSLLEK